jgi:hypothetical protein
VFAARSADLNFNCGQILREALDHLGLRGGGSADLAEGEVPAGQKTILRASVSDAILRGSGDDAKQQERLRLPSEDNILLNLF